jgi:hypothetical protein
MLLEFPRVFIEALSLPQAQVEKPEWLSILFDSLQLTTD